MGDPCVVLPQILRHASVIGAHKATLFRSPPCPTVLASWLPARLCRAHSRRPLILLWCWGSPRTMPGPRETRTRIQLWWRVRTGEVQLLSPRWNQLVEQLCEPPTSGSRRRPRSIGCWFPQNCLTASITGFDTLAVTKCSPNRKKSMQCWGTGQERSEMFVEL